MVPGSALVLLVAVACIRASGAGVEEPFLCQSVARLEGDGVPRSHALACEGGLHGSFTSLRDWLDTAGSCGSSPTVRPGLVVKSAQVTCQLECAARDDAGRSSECDGVWELVSRTAVLQRAFAVGHASAEAQAGLNFTVSFASSSELCRHLGGRLHTAMDGRAGRAELDLNLRVWKAHGTSPTSAPTHDGTAASSSCTLHFLAAQNCPSRPAQARHQQPQHDWHPIGWPVTSPSSPTGLGVWRPDGLELLPPPPPISSPSASPSADDASSFTGTGYVWNFTTRGHWLSATALDVGHDAETGSRRRPQGSGNGGLWVVDVEAGVATAVFREGARRVGGWRQGKADILRAAATCSLRWKASEGEESLVAHNAPRHWLPSNGSDANIGDDQHGGLAVDDEHRVAELRVLRCEGPGLGLEGRGGWGGGCSVGEVVAVAPVLLAAVNRSTNPGADGDMPGAAGTDAVQVGFADGVASPGLRAIVGQVRRHACTGLSTAAHAGLLAADGQDFCVLFTLLRCRIRTELARALGVGGRRMASIPCRIRAACFRNRVRHMLLPRLCFGVACACFCLAGGLQRTQGACG